MENRIQHKQAPELLPENITTIEEAKRYLKLHWWDGVDCPVCKQRVQLYKRKIYAAMAYGLIVLYKINHDLKTWIHVPTEFNKRKMIHTGDFAKMKAWGLLEEKPNEDDPDKTNSGYWRISQKGIDFVENKITVQKYIVFYNQKEYLHMQVKDNIQINIIDALGTKFSYQELMNGQ